MKKKNSLSAYIFISFLFFCSLFLLFFIPLNSGKNTWDGYKILFLPIAADVSKILEEAKKENINDIISVESVKNRFKDIEKSLYLLPEFTDRERYAQWFLNDQENIQYMYIPENQQITKSFIKFLKCNTEFFYIEDINPFSLFQMIVVSLFFIFSFFYTKRKLIFFSANIPFIIYVGFQKGILALTATFLMMYTVAFWVEAVGSHLKFTKEQLLRRIRKNPLLVFLPVFSLVIAKFNSNLSLFMFVLAVIAGGSLTYLTGNIKLFLNEEMEAKKLHSQIKPYLMNPKSIDKFWNSKKLFIVSGAVIFLIIFSSLLLLFRFTKTMQAYKNNVFLPLPAKSMPNHGFSKSEFDNVHKIRSGEDLPDLANFIKDSWLVEASPYMRIDEGFDKDEINISDFSVDKSGVVAEKNSIILKLDDEFIQKIIAFRKGPLIEDLLYAQNKFTTAIYASKVFPLNRYNFAALFVALLSSFIPMIIIILRVCEK